VPEPDEPTRLNVMIGQLCDTPCLASQAAVSGWPGRACVRTCFKSPYFSKVIQYIWAEVLQCHDGHFLKRPVHKVKLYNSLLGLDDSVSALFQPETESPWRRRMGNNEAVRPRESQTAKVGFRSSVPGSTQ
jgi:hypothetical protein